MDLSLILHPQRSLTNDKAHYKVPAAPLSKVVDNQRNKDRAVESSGTCHVWISNLLWMAWTENLLPKLVFVIQTCFLWTLPHQHFAAAQSYSGKHIHLLITTLEPICIVKLLEEIGFPVIASSQSCWSWRSFFCWGMLLTLNRFLKYIISNS